MWWRYRNWPRPSQLEKRLSWTIMPVGFIGMIEAFKNYKEDNKKKKSKKKGDQVVTEPGRYICILLCMYIYMCVYIYIYIYYSFHYIIMFLWIMQLTKMSWSILWIMFLPSRVRTCV